jgi:CRISPR-associated protein Csx3
MTRSYRIVCNVRSQERTDLEVGFIGEAHNNQRVLDAVSELAALALTGGRLVTLDGPCSLPVAFAIAHGVSHLFGAVAVKDPKLGKFVVAVSHRPDLIVGTLID